MSPQCASHSPKKPTKEGRSFCPEEVHATQPCGRPDPQPHPKEQADRERISHAAHMGPCRRLDSPRRPSAPLLRRRAYRSAGGSGGIGLQCVGSKSTSTRCRHPTPVLPLPACLPRTEQE